jgi:alkanesulfonate monooxygenase SsuD/methylene tetrahydromethanopterin reductase-like flavin-dependent oxidoreductase (luciferase family)
MRFSIWPSLAQAWDDVLTVARHGEATGWDRVYVADHFIGDGESAGDPDVSAVLEATGAVTALAASTQRVRLATLVLGITYRHPAVLANWAATADHVSDGRLVLGLGAGWQRNEHEQYGIELGRPGVRVDRLGEACTIIRSLLTERTTTFNGRYFQLRDALCEPKSVQPHVPLLIGARGDRMLGVVARHADEWNMWGLAADIAERRAVLDSQCERQGRDPGDIATSCQAVWFVTDDDAKGKRLAAESPARAAIGGTTTRLAEHVAEWQAVGVDEIIVPDFTLGTGSSRIDRMDAIIEQVAPQFRT